MSGHGRRTLNEDSAWDATPDELRAWASDANATWPSQDWDLAVARDDLAPELMALAGAEDCPNRGFFLNALYVLIGDAIYREWEDHDSRVLSAFVDRALEHPDSAIRLWARRSHELLKHPETFEYAAWCQGGLAKTPE